MKIILKKDVNRIGKAGEVISVKDGFARNFLLPKDLALIATADNISKFEVQNKRREQERNVEKTKVQELADRLKGHSCTIAAEVHDDNLYGSVSSQDISEALKEEQLNIDAKDILLEEPIKKLGIYEVEVKLHSEVNTIIKVWVVKK